MIGIGPFSIQAVVAAAAVLVAWITARVCAKRGKGVARKEAGGVIVDAVFWGLVAARLGYIAQWWDDYYAAPLSMIALGDGGFSWWVGVPTAVLFVWWRTRAAQALRSPVLTGIVAGVVAWTITNGLVELMYRSAPPLPDLPLTTLDARPVSLGAYAGRPVVLNLWASWCPPCRREMPVFESAQSEFPDVAIVLINQGESALQARTFLDDEGLSLTDVLLDPSSSAMQALKSRGLPTTLFFDAEGRLVDAHLGEMTMPSLKDKVSRRFPKAGTTSGTRIGRP